MKIYQLSCESIGLPVHFFFPKRKLECEWTRIYGIQIGDWFFGAIKGRGTEFTTENIAPIHKDKAK